VGDGVSPMLLTNYARVLSDLDRSDEAAQYVDRAYAEAQRDGNELVANMALALQIVVRRSRGDLDGAQQALDAIVPRLHQTLPPDHYFFALALSERSLIAAARHDDAGALELANRAVAALATKHAGNPLVVPLVLVRRAKLDLALGRPHDAEADATKALALEQTLLPASQSSSLVGRTYLALANAQAAEDKQRDAQRSFAAAAERLRPTLGADHPDTQLAERSAGASDPSAAR
jgi:tetratricopeptide (TPR) repeat protein